MIVFSSVSAPSFVPRNDVVATMPKAVRDLARHSVSRQSGRKNDIKMMPIGVPKVAYRVPWSQGADW